MERKSFTKQYSSVEEAARAAADRVKKWHPDTSGLTPAEKKTMRRLMPFYAWTRQALPMVLGAAITHPGRSMVVPKAQYNLAVAMGMDPHSVGDQFPIDTLYPSYMLNDVGGPISKGGLSANFGTGTEFLNDVITQPGQTIAGMVNPLAKVPIEAATGTALGSGGIPIGDTSEHWDQMVPGANLTNIAGISPTGSIGDIVTGQGWVDPQRKVAMGQKQAFKNKNLASFLTGVNWTQTSDPARLKSLYYEGGGRSGA
jgi:hypothetical protein